MTEEVTWEKPQGFLMDPSPSPSASPNAPSTPLSEASTQRRSLLLSDNESPSPSEAVPIPAPAPIRRSIVFADPIAVDLIAERKAERKAAEKASKAERKSRRRDDADVAVQSPAPAPAPAAEAANNGRGLLTIIESLEPEDLFLVMACRGAVKYPSVISLLAEAARAVCSLAVLAALRRA